MEVVDHEPDGLVKRLEINRPDVLDLRRILAGVDRLRDDEPPQPEALAAFHQRRSGERRGAVIAAIRKLDRAGQPVTVAGVAALAGVDRSYIYDHPDLLDEIRQMRTTTPAKFAPRPAADRATAASLQARLASAHEEIARLKAENSKLRDRLAIALGEVWETEVSGTRCAVASPASGQARR